MKEVDECIAKMIPPHNRDDFKQDLFLILMAKDEETIIRLYESDQLKLYCAGIIIRQAHQSRSAYNVRYKGPANVEFTDGIMLVDQEYEELPDITPEMLAEVDRTYKTEGEFPFYTRLVEALQKVRSMRELSRETGISLSTISKRMKKIRSHIKGKIYD